MSVDRTTFEALDQADPLAPLRDQFLLPHGVIYLDGAPPITIERIIGNKRVGYLRQVVDVQLFPELWRVRTQL